MEMEVWVRTSGRVVTTFPEASVVVTSTADVNCDVAADVAAVTDSAAEEAATEACEAA